MEILDKEQPTTILGLFKIAIKTKNTDILKKYQLIFSKIIDERKRVL